MMKLDREVLVTGIPLIEWFCDQVQNDDRKLARFLSRTPYRART